jgi:hypothetical protein
MVRLLALFFILALPAVAQDVRPADLGRLAELRGILLGAPGMRAQDEGDPADVAILREALAGLPGALAPEGDWNCRTLKLGGGLALVVYGNFRCRITVEGAGWRLEKLTGSQRTQGLITLRDGEAFYLGVGYVSGGPATDYAGLPPDSQTPVEPGQTHAQVGIFEQMGADRARLLLPAPILESEFDILYLTR